MFVNQKPVGVIEAKQEEEGRLLSVCEKQSQNYARSKLTYLQNDPLPFVNESTGQLTRFTDCRYPKPCSRLVFSFHRPETLLAWIKQGLSLRKRL
ncbi:MAG: hypothetical protein HQM11_02330 [SAR324 cluster bacterium]|nr:hypothetical protein [SAR324 cluster bacterium]